MIKRSHILRNINVQKKLNNIVDAPSFNNKKVNINENIVC